MRLVGRAVPACGHWLRTGDGPRPGSRPYDEPVMTVAPHAPADGPGAALRQLHPALRWALDLASTVRHRQLSATAFRRLSALAVGGLALIIVSGAAVRLTGSGLGCPDWPTCAAGNVVAPWRFHAWVEFGNRLITAGLSIAVGLAVLGALVRATRRRDLTLLALGLVGGLVAEIILGGLTVEHKLAPGFVMAHFLLAMLFLADAVVLHHRAGLPEQPVPGRPGRAQVTGPAVRLVTAEQRVLAALLIVATAIVVGLGSVVTSTGPHGGAPQAQRFGFSLHDVAQLHGSSVEVYLLFVVATIWLMVRSGAPRLVVRRAEILLVAIVIQGGIGYTQYFLGVPAGLVEVHVAGAVVVVIAVLRLNLSLSAHPEPLGPTASIKGLPTVRVDNLVGG
jgi:cytochrome c oxidase assembly protein subunit 15